VEQNDDSFKKMNPKEKIITVISITLLMIILIGFILGILFFGFAGIFTLFGVSYQSIWSLVIFVISFFVLGFFIDIFFDALTKLAIKDLSSKGTIFFIQFIFGFASNWLVLFTVDAFMDSIKFSPKAMLIITLILALLEPVFDNKKKVNSN
jgi:energy-coupling factor transporter transmembrane protein EcfT